jgi:hypothetical protein
MSGAKPKRQQPMGAKAVRGSDAARRHAALLMEVWSGVRTTQAASEAMGIAVTRFYQLEARALQMMVSAMEPRQRGRPRTAESELGKLKLEKQRLLRDVERFQSLYRTAQRALGVAVAKPVDKAENPAPGGRRKRGPRKKARGQAVAAALLGGAQPEGAREASDGATEQGTGPRERTVGRPAAEATLAEHPEHARRAAVR